MTNVNCHVSDKPAQTGVIAITGGTGFLGKYLIAKLSSNAEIEIRALTRLKLVPVTTFKNVVFVQGDMFDISALHKLIEPGATLINLAFSNTTNIKDAIVMSTKLVDACIEKGVKRLIHCSSISVYGRVNGIVTETTPCLPHDEYGKTKLAIENTLLDRSQGHLEVIILRPSEVFGCGGKTLMSLLHSLTERGPLINYARSLLFGKRRTHLVPVEMLVEAIHFFCIDERKYEGEIFNVTADHDAINRFNIVEQLLKQELQMPNYLLPVLPVPGFVLKSILRLSKRATIDHQVLYSSEKLLKSGFDAHCDLASSLRTLARNYQKNKNMDSSV